LQAANADEGFLANCNLWSVCASLDTTGEPGLQFNGRCVALFFKFDFKADEAGLRGDNQQYQAQRAQAHHADGSGAAKVMGKGSGEPACRSARLRSWSNKSSSGGFKDHFQIAVGIVAKKVSGDDQK
jgi:hypothetical protein